MKFILRALFFLSLLTLPPAFALQCPELLKSVSQEGEWFLTESGKPVPLKKPARPNQPNIKGNLELLYGEVPVFHFQTKNADGIWSAGGVQGKYVNGIYLKTPRAEYRDLDYTLFLRGLFFGALGRVDGFDRPSWLSGKQVAFALHTEHAGKSEGSYWAIAGDRFEQHKDSLPPHIRNIPEQFFNMVAANYRKRLHMSEENIERLLKISREVMNRSVFILKTKQSFLSFGSKEEASHQATADFEIEAGIVLVWSRGKHEPLPMELFNGETVPRLHKVSAEIGRFVVEKGSVKDLSAREFQAASAALVGMGVTEAKGEADFKRVPIFTRLGWQIQYNRPSNYEGNPESILTADPFGLVGVNIGPMAAPMYRFERNQTSLLHALNVQVGSRLW